MKKTWTRNDLIEAVSNNIGLSLSESSKLCRKVYEKF